MATKTDVKDAVKEVLKEQLSITGLAASTLPDAWNKSVYYLAAYGAMAAAPDGRARQASDVWAHRFRGVESDGSLSSTTATATTHLRWTRHAAQQARDAIAELSQKLDVLLAANEGLDTQAILARIDRNHDELVRMAEAADAYYDELADRLNDVAELVEQASSGELTAEQVVALIADRLAPTNAEEDS